MFGGDVVCSAPPCWEAQPNGGFRFKDAANFYGISLVKLKPGDAGRAKIIVKSKGAGFSALLPLATPVEPLPSTVYLRNGSGGCWAADFVEYRKNDGTGFKAKTP